MTITKFETRPTLNEVSLRQENLWRAEGDLRGEQITCTAGTLWVTQANDPKDYILNVGEIFWVTRPGTVLVQGLTDGQFSFSRFAAHNHPGRN
jgi:hypothetical protein